MLFLKEHLQNEYNWPVESEVSLYSGVPTRRKFDRYNGHQVLFIINFYASISDRSSIRDGKTMEDLIHSQLPLDARSEISVFNWLRETFNKEAVQLPS